MTSYLALAMDVYRYYTRDYDDHSAHCRKMMRKHGDAKWHAAVVIGHGVICEHGKTRCMAFCVDEIARAMEATYHPMEMRGCSGNAGITHISGKSRG